MSQNIVAIIQARLNSVRLPGKVLKQINGIPAIEFLFKRISKSKYLDNIVVLLLKIKKFSSNKFLNKKNINLYSGEDQNVLKRFFDAANIYNASIIVRITGDSVLLDYRLLDNMIKKFVEKKVDFLCNTQPMTYPDGQDIEIFLFKH